MQAWIGLSYERFFLNWRWNIYQNDCESLSSWSLVKHLFDNCHASTVPANEIIQILVNVDLKKKPLFIVDSCLLPSLPHSPPSNKVVAKEDKRMVTRKLFFIAWNHIQGTYLRRRAGGGASLWSKSRSSSLPVDIAGGGGSRGDLSSVQGSGLGRLLTWTVGILTLECHLKFHLLTMSSSPSLGTWGEGERAVGACEVFEGSFRIQALHTGYSG